jgi:hypothetical protein
VRRLGIKYSRNGRDQPSISSCRWESHTNYSRKYRTNRANNIDSVILAPLLLILMPVAEVPARLRY